MQKLNSANSQREKLLFNLLHAAHCYRRLQRNYESDTNATSFERLNEAKNTLDSIIETTFEQFNHSDKFTIANYTSFIETVKTAL